MADTDVDLAAPAKLGKYSRNRSILAVTENPFEAAALLDGLNVEVLSDAVLVGDALFADVIFSPLKEISANEERISRLEAIKVPYLFSSAQLLELCQLTTSLKTRIEFIKQIGPRLVDPTAKTADFMGMFRFAEEKTQVELVLKSRSSALGISQLTNVRRSSNILASRGGRGGGRGGNRAPEESQAQAPSHSMASMFGGVSDATVDVDDAAAEVEKCSIDA